MPEAGQTTLTERETHVLRRGENGKSYLHLRYCEGDDAEQRLRVAAVTRRDFAALSTQMHALGAVPKE